MQEKSDAQLLRDFAGRSDEAAFREIVTRHTDLVYSAARRQVESDDLAADIAQSVFVDLARKAKPVGERLTAYASLAGWLHRSTRYLALNHLRDTRRRLTNERQAMEQLLTDSESSVNWEQIRPELDEALDSLDDEDREVLLLRYFKNLNYRAVGLALGVSDDTAQKRVSRAVERLREFFAQRGVAVGAGGLGVVISANAIQAAPAGLAVTISSAAIVGTAVSTSTIIAATKTITMTTLQKIIITTTLAAAVGAGIYEASQNSKLREQNQTLQQQQAPLAGQIQQLQRERDSATNRLALVVGELATTKKNPSEVLKLRGEVGALRNENKIAGEKSAINKLTSDPASRKVLRDQQKMGMTSIYKDYAKHLKLTPELTDKLNDLLADSVMDNIDLITQVLHDGNSPAELEQIFSGADKALLDKVQALLGDDGLAQYKSYTQNLASTLTGAQFDGFLTGDKAAKENKRKQLIQAMQEETAVALKNAGLPADYQVIPMLNFRNIASEETSDQSLKLLDGIYGRMAERGSSFLSPEELASLETFRTNALNSSRSMLTMNRTLMAPISK